MTELGTLENKRLSDLHQIASQLGIPKYRTYRKPELAQRIYQVATEQADGQSAQEETASAVAEAAPATETIPEPAPAESDADAGSRTPARRPGDVLLQNSSTGAVGRTLRLRLMVAW